MKIQSAAVAAAVTAGGASAATVVGATTVRITNVLPTWLQVAEVRALDFSDVNVAWASNGAVASVPDKYSDFYSDVLPADDGPENAIDGVVPFA